MRTLLALLALLLATAAQAQTPSPAQMGITSTTTPEVLQTLDCSKTWVPLGFVDPTLHVFNPIGALDPRSFGANCDGTTDDTTALAAWAAAIQAGSTAHVVGRCVTKQPITFPVVNHVALRGDGIGSSQLIYAGTSTTATVFNFGSTSAATGCAINQWTIQNITFESNTQMTGGFGVEISQSCDGIIQNVSIGSQFGGSKNWFSGIHYNGGNSVRTSNLYLTGHNLAAGQVPGSQGIVVNGTTAHAFTDPYFNNVLGTFFDTGINIAGNVGGFDMEQSDILENNTQVRISQDQVAIGNLQIFFGKVALDLTFSGPEVDLVDPGGSQPFLTFGNTWLATSFSHGLFVHAGTNWNVLMNGGFVYNNGRGSTSVDGIHNESTTGRIWVNGTRFGATGGYCVNSTVTNTGIVLINPLFAGLAACTTGSYNSNITPIAWPDLSNGGGSFNFGDAASFRGAGESLQFRPTVQTHGTDMNNWDMSYDVNGNIAFRAVNDAYTASSVFATMNRGSGFSLTGGSWTFNVPILVQNFTIATLPTCNSGLAGGIVYVTNGQATPTYLGAVSTTGTTVAPVFCNGSGWVYH